MSTDKPSKLKNAGADHSSLVGVRTRLSQGCRPIVSLLERLSDECLDDLSSELASLDSADMTEFVAALDTLDHLAHRLGPALSSDNAVEPVVGRSALPVSIQVPAVESVDVLVDELAAMLVELMLSFESSEQYDAVDNANWRSPDGRCEISKSGQSAALLWSLQQDPEAVFAEYRLYLDGQEVWSWSDKVWPDLCADASIEPTVRIPTVCLEAVTRHLEQYSVEWVERWRRINPDREPAIQRVS